MLLKLKDELELEEEVTELEPLFAQGEMGAQPFGEEEWEQPLACPGATRQIVTSFPRHQYTVTSLPPTEQRKIRNLAFLIVQSFRPGCHPILAVRLIGHADKDRQRGPVFERQISLRRALAVRQALEQLINNPSISSMIRWDSQGIGATRVLVPNPRTELERMRNRRVEAWLNNRRLEPSSPMYIRWVQNCLNQVLRTRLAVNGILNPETRSVLSNFQQRQRLAANGMVTPQTITTLIRVCGSSPIIFPPPFDNLPKGMKLVPHMHVRRTCPDASSWTSDASPRPMSPANMNPGFILANDQINFDKKLDDALIDLMVTKHPTLLSKESVKRRLPSMQDKLRVALVDLTGNKICRPGYAGWGSTWLMPGASTAKIGIVYAVHQLLFDLRELVRVNSIRKTTDLTQKAGDTWKALTCTPDLNWLFSFDDTVDPLGVEKSPKLNDHLGEMVDARFSNVSTTRASELIRRVGFEYIASVLWSSGLHHPGRKGLWLGSTYCTEPRKARHDPHCHVVAPCTKLNRVIWVHDPLNVKRIVLTALSVATFFTLLAQERLVNVSLSREMETLLVRGCTLFSPPSPAATIRATKCGVVEDIWHVAALIENGTRRYVVVFLTKNAHMSFPRSSQLLQELDQLIKDNNP